MSADSDQYVCEVCDWVYDETLGDPENGIDPGTGWNELPDDWSCPVCGAGKDEFAPVESAATLPSDSSSAANSSGGFYLAQWERKSDDLEGDFRGILARAIDGHEEISAMRTRKWRNLLEDIVILPGQLARRPIDFRQLDPDLSVVIGPKAAKPLHLDRPFYVSDMSFGSLSKEAKIALAKGSAASGTAIFSGEGGLLEEEYQAARSFVFEYSTGRFGASDENIKKAHAIQIKIGQAAKAGMGGHLMAVKVTPEIAAARGVEPGKSLISPANHADMVTHEDLSKKVAHLRELSEGVPIGVKIAAGWVERDIEVAVNAGVDFITIDCRGGATGAAPNHIKDNVCIPLPYALGRARRFLDACGASGRVSLLITGGVRTSGDIAKCLAMGADAVGLATASMIGIGCQQYRVCHKGSCPVGIATQDAALRARFDVDRSAAMLKNLFDVYGAELADFIRICGKRRISELGLEDLTALTRDVADGTGISFAGEKMDI